MDSSSQQASRMFKSTLLLVAVLVLVVDASKRHKSHSNGFTSKPSMEDLPITGKCTIVLEKAVKVCLDPLPEGLKNMVNPKEMRKHPEWCCLAYKVCLFGAVALIC